MKSEISWGKNCRGSARKPKKPEVLLREDPTSEETLKDSEDPEEIVARAEARAREDQKKAGSKRTSKFIGGKRQYAEALHRQADILHHRGDYEAALVLYHRASTANPKEPSHGVAVRRTATAITTATNPSGGLKKFFPRTNNPAQLAADYCPETAALRARKVIEESTNPISAIDQILKYLDCRKDFWRDSPISEKRQRSNLLTKSRNTLRRLSNMAITCLQNLQASYASGDSIKSLKNGEELMIVSAALPDRYCYQVAARQYMAMTQISLGRHDRAIDQVSSMVKLAKESGDASLRSRSMMTLGRVHLSFRHLDAAARAWEKLVVDLEGAVPKAWLLHEIGRCHFETKRYARALETARRCLEYADEGESRKWLLHGKLLYGQSLVELGRLGEAVEVLKATARVARENEDTSTFEYVTDLIDRVSGLLRRSVCLDEEAEKKDELSKQKDDETVKDKLDKKIEYMNQSKFQKRKNLSRSCNSKEKSKIISSKCLARKNKSPKGSRIKNDRRVQGRRKNIGMIENFVLTIYPTRSKLNLSVSENGFDELKSLTARITSSERSQRETDRSTRKDFYENRDGLFTSRPHVIHAKLPNNENSIVKLENLVGKEIEDDKNEIFNSDSETSDRSGVTYVLDELDKSSITERKLGDYLNGTNLEERHCGNEDTDKTDTTDVPDNSNGDEYFKDDRPGHPEILELRARLYEKGIDEEEEDEEKEENDEEEVVDGEKVQSSSLNDCEVSSPRESKVSSASTGKTYFVDERKTMSSSETRSRFFDNEKKMRNERNCQSSRSISPVRHSFREVDSIAISDIIKAIGDIPRDSIFEKQKKQRNVTNLSTMQSTVEIQEKYNSLTRSSFFGEHCENDAQGIRATLVEHLATGESIYTSRSHGFVSFAGQNPLYRHSLPTSARREKQPQSP